MVIQIKWGGKNFHKYSNKNWTPEEIEWLLENANKGAHYAVKELNKSYSTIVNQAYRMRISLRTQNYKGKRMLGEVKINKPAPKLYQIKPITIKQLRESVLIRDGYKCGYCGIKLTKENTTLDHKIPVSAGGKTTYNNLISCCRKCNYTKGQVCYECPHLEARLGVSDG